jgi:hypothetical protein
LSVSILNRRGRVALLAAFAVMSFATAAFAADAPTPTIEHTGDWRAAVHRFAEANLKHPAWGLSHSVRGAIRTHMFARDPVGPEAIYLHDADALDWLGAIGVARVFGLVDPNGGSPDGPTVVQRLEHSLTGVPPRIVSKAGKARTPERVRELEQFLRDLRRESADYRSL